MSGSIEAEAGEMKVQININLDTIFDSGDETAVEGNAGDNRTATGPGAYDSGQLLHERAATLNGQMEGGPEQSERRRQICGLFGGRIFG